MCRLLETDVCQPIPDGSRTLFLSTLNRSSAAIPNPALHSMIDKRPLSEKIDRLNV